MATVLINMKLYSDDAILLGECGGYSQDRNNVQFFLIEENEIVVSAKVDFRHTGGFPIQVHFMLAKME